MKSEAEVQSSFESEQTKGTAVPTAEYRRGRRRGASGRVRRKLEIVRVASASSDTESAPKTPGYDLEQE